MDKQPTKCSVRDGKFVEPCRLLEKATEYGNPRGKQKGVFAYEWHTPAGPSRTFYGAKSGEYVTGGLVFNFCPYCGERIDAPFAKDDEPKAERAGGSQ